MFVLCICVVRVSVCCVYALCVCVSECVYVDGCVVCVYVLFM